MAIEIKKPGQKPQGKVHIQWSADFAYAVGLIASDGCLSQDLRHVSFVSIDMEQVLNYQKCLDTSCKIGISKSSIGTPAFRVQLSDTDFYKFLVGIGLTPAKSKTIGKLLI